MNPINAFNSKNLLPLSGCGFLIPTSIGVVFGIIGFLSALHVKVGFLSFLGGWGIGGAVGIVIIGGASGIFVVYVIGYAKHCCCPHDRYYDYSPNYNKKPENNKLPVSDPPPSAKPGPVKDEKNEDFKELVINFEVANKDDESLSLLENLPLECYVSIYKDLSIRDLFVLSQTSKHCFISTYSSFIDLAKKFGFKANIPIDVSVSNDADPSDTEKKEIGKNQQKEKGLQARSFLINYFNCFKQLFQEAPLKHIIFPEDCVGLLARLDYCYSNLEAIRANLVGSGRYIEQLRTLFVNAIKENNIQKVLFIGPIILPLQQKFFNSFLVEAMEMGHTEIRDLLIISGVDVNKSHNGRTPLSYALGDLPFMETLFSYNATPSLIVHRKLFNDRVLPIHDAAILGCAKTIEMLAKYGADVTAVSETHRKTPLHFACAAGRLEAAKCLIQLKANIEATCLKGLTPLMEAVEHKEMLQWLVTNGANVNASTTDAFGQYITPLSCAVKEGYLESVRILIAAGADIQKCQKNLIQNSRNLEIKALLTNPLHSAIKAGNSELVKSFLSKGYKPETRDIDQDVTALYLSVSNPEILALLIEWGGGDCIDKLCGSDRSTALHSAVEKGLILSVATLLEQKPKLEIANKKGSTPLFCCQNRNIATMLIDAGAKIDATNDKGENLLLFALEMDWMEMAKFWLETKRC